MKIYTKIHGESYTIKVRKPGPKNKVRKEVISLRLYPTR